MTCGHGREAERTSVKSALTAFGGLRSMSFETILPSALAAEAAPVRPPGSTVRWTSSGLAHAEPDHRRRVRETKTTVAVTSTPPSTDRSTGLPRGGVVDCSRILQVSPSGPSLISVLGSLTTSVSQPAARGCRLRDRPRRRQVHDPRADHPPVRSPPAEGEFTSASCELPPRLVSGSTSRFSGRRNIRQAHEVPYHIAELSADKIVVSVPKATSERIATGIVWIGDKN